MEPILLSNGELAALTSISDSLKKQMFSKGNTVWLSIDFVALLRSTRIHFKKSELAANFIVSCILSDMNDDQTLLVSTFNFDFPKTKIFDRVNTHGQTGAFGNLLLKEYYKERLDHPFYSFIVLRKDGERPNKNTFMHSSGPDSVFDWLIKSNTELVALGHHYVKAFSTIHHAEHLADIDFRYVKTFSGELHEDGKFIRDIRTSLYVRDIDKCDFSSLTYEGDITLRKESACHSTLIASADKPILAHFLDLKKAHNIFMPDLVERRFELIDYFGPSKPNKYVITGNEGDKLYQKELISLSSSE